jgi:hypothetical protein
MKASELIEILKDYPDFEVEPTLSNPDGSKWGFSVTTFKIKWVTDIGHSEKKIILDIEEEV